MIRPPQIQRLRVENYRALRDLSVSHLRPLTVLIGPNGSGKSTFFDVFAFLSDCFAGGVRSACDRRGGLGEIRSRDSSGNVGFEPSYKESRGSRLLTYRLELGDEAGYPVIRRELLRWRTAPGPGRPTHILDFADGNGVVYDAWSATGRAAAPAFPLRGQPPQCAAVSAGTASATAGGDQASAAGKCSTAAGGRLRADPGEVLVLVRDGTGYARATWAGDVDMVVDQVQSGGQLGWLWQEGYLDVLPEPRAHTPADLAD